MVLSAALARRTPLGILPTPLAPAPRLSSALGFDVWLKRDDLIGFAQAGTKTRPLEFLLGDAVEAGADCVVGCGGAGSNFTAALAAAATRAGLECHLVLHGSAPAGTIVHPNLGAARAWGASVHFTGNPDREAVDAAAAEHTASLAAAGRRPYLVPRGGATAVGAVGGALSVAELAPPLGDRPPGRIVVAAGSGTTAAGLLAGLAGRRWPTTLVAAAVSRTVDETRAVILALAGDCAARLGAPPPDGDALQVVDAIGPGFAVAGDEGRRAAGVALRTEGLVLDHTYTAKAFAALLDQPPLATATVFWHTGGIAGAMAGLAGPEAGGGS